MFVAILGVVAVGGRVAVCRLVAVRPAILLLLASMPDAVTASLHFHQQFYYGNGIGIVLGELVARLG